MKKQKYLRSLRKALKNVPKGEKENLIEYYSELIDDAYERGKSSKEVFAELEDPDTVARNYLREKCERPYDEDAFDDRRRDYEDAPRYEPRRTAPRRRERDYDEDFERDYERSKRRPVGDREQPKRRQIPAWLLVVLFPIWFPLLVVACALGLTVMAVGLALVIAFLVVIIAMFVGGIYSIVMSFGVMGANFQIALVQIGAGLALIGLGNLLSRLFVPCCRLYGSFVAWVFRGFRSSQKERRVRSHRGFIAGLVSGVCVLIIGVVVGTIGFSNLGFDHKQLAVLGEATDRTEVISLEEADMLSFYADNLNLNVVKTDGEARVEWKDFAEAPREFSQEGESFSLKSDLWKEGGWNYLKQVWSRGIWFNTVYSLNNRATLYLPQDYAGSLKVEVDNGGVTLSSLSLDGIEVLAKNGAVTVNGCTASSVKTVTRNGAIVLENLSAQSVNVESKNGYFVAKQLTGAQLGVSVQNGYVTLSAVDFTSVHVESRNGAVNLDRISSAEIFLSTHNGAIMGNVLGNQAEYRIFAETTNGACNLQNRTEGEKSLDVQTHNGAINIWFVGE